MEKFSETGSTLEYEISIPVHLEDGSSVVSLCVLSFCCGGGNDCTLGINELSD